MKSKKFQGVRNRKRTQSQGNDRKVSINQPGKWQGNLTPNPGPLGQKSPERK